MTTNDQDRRFCPSNWSPTAFRWWVAGYERGVLTGERHGYAAAIQDMIPIHTFLKEMDINGMVRAREARERQFDGHKCLTAEQVRAKAAASWGLEVMA